MWYDVWTREGSTSTIVVYVCVLCVASHTVLPPDCTHCMTYASMFVTVCWCRHTPQCPCNTNTRHHGMECVFILPAMSEEFPPFYTDNMTDVWSGKFPAIFSDIMCNAATVTNLYGGWYTGLDFTKMWIYGRAKLGNIPDICHYPVMAWLVN